MSEYPFEPLWSLLLTVVGFLYLTKLGRVLVGLKRLKAEPDQVPGDQPLVSVVIPCRNEARGLGAALNDLAVQDYPADRLQIIVVDDRSDDGTGDAARSRQHHLRDLTVLRVESCPDHLSPKKYALSRGLALATGEILVTTDGDCRFSTGWISSLVSRFAPDVGLVTGLTIFDRGRPEPFWQRLQQLDYLSHSFFAAGSIGSGKGLNCNGSNLAMRREAFTQAGGYSAIGPVITGDDTLLLQRLQALSQWRVIFSADPRSTVRSWPEETPREVFDQRLRWGSGGLSYSRPALAFALVAFLFFLGLFLSPYVWLAKLISPLWMFLFLLKVIQEGRVMARGFKTFRIKSDWLAFFALEIIHVPAILTFSIGGHITGFLWKGQRFKRRRTSASPIPETPSP